MAKPPKTPTSLASGKKKSSRGKEPFDGPSELYAIAWKRALDMEHRIQEIDKELEVAVLSTHRARLEREKKALREAFGNLDRYPEIAPRLHEYVSQRGGNVDDISDLIKFLRQHCPRLRMIEDPALRAHLKYAFGLEGSRGRKKKPNISVS